METAATCSVIGLEVTDLVGSGGFWVSHRAKVKVLAKCGSRSEEEPASQQIHVWGRNLVLTVLLFLGWVLFLFTIDRAMLNQSNDSI